MRERFDVVGIGYSSVDYLGIVPGYPPEADEKTEMLEFSMPVSYTHLTLPTTPYV